MADTKAEDRLCRYCRRRKVQPRRESLSHSLKYNEYKERRKEKEEKK